jgi:hypothetical protein
MSDTTFDKKYIQTVEMFLLTAPFVDDFIFTTSTIDNGSSSHLLHQVLVVVAL